MRALQIRLPTRAVPAFSLLMMFVSSASFPQSQADADPFSQHEKLTVLLFARSDCPITRRYAPELQRIAREFESKPVAFWLVFPDSSETVESVRTFVDQYHLPGTALQDPKHSLVRLAHATVAPEAAVFTREGRLVYHGRIDDRYVDIGKTKPAAQVHDLEDAIASTLTGRPVAQAQTRAVGCYLADVE